MCTIKADISNVDVAIGPGPAGLVLVRAFDVVLTCGATEMKAHIRWEEKVGCLFVFPIMWFRLTMG